MSDEQFSNEKWAVALMSLTQDYPKTPDGHYLHRGDVIRNVASIVERIRKATREQCAKIAETATKYVLLEEHGDEIDGTAKQIAATIREMKP